MSLITAWVLAPALLLLICVGHGLALERLFRAQVPAALLAGLGLASLVALTTILTAFPATTGLALPAALVFGAAGLLTLSPQRIGRLARSSSTRWAALAALAVFAVYAAPVVLSGNPTFTGYIKLDDTSTWLAFADHVLAHGRDLDSLAVSTYQTTLDVNIGGGYPVGSFLPLAILSRLTGTDPAWLFNPYLATIVVLVLISRNPTWIRVNMPSSIGKPFYPGS